MALLRPNETCRRIERADRLAFLIDGAAYFHTLREAFKRAERSIFVLCWDINSRVRMVRDGRGDGYPPELGRFLRTVLARNRRLHAHILAWDFHMIYAFERQWWSLLPFRLGPHRRLHFHMDDVHPVWACHHQKVIVVDDRLALVGGLDPTRHRWDTPEHRAQDPRRVDPEAGRYAPFHDVQLMVSGPAAAALGELARERWYRATGQRVAAPARSETDLWPPGITPDLVSVPVGIARTQPAMNGQPEVREIEQLILEAIASARRHLYIESQFLTSESVAAALMARLQATRGPDIVLLVHPNSSGWLEQHTMDVLRARILRRIRAADRYHRLGVYYPDIPGLGDRCITMHSKLMIVDDEFARVGSANLSNRSMGLDTECDVAVEARGEPRIEAAIAGLRHRLLGEHLGVDPEKVAERLGATGSLLATVEQLRGPGRSLNVFEPKVPPDLDAWVPNAALIDPAKPLEPDVFADEFVPQEQRRPARRRVIAAAALLLGLIGLAAAWHWTPLRHWLDVSMLADYLSAFQDSMLAPWVVLGGFVVGSLLVMPVTVLIAVTVLSFGAWPGFLYALAGVLLGAAATYGVGHLLGQRGVRRLAGARLNRLSKRLAERGVLAVTAVRVIPVAPFTVVNLVAGASHIRFRDFLLGTAIGMMPGLIGMTVFVDRMLEAIRHPGPVGIAVMIAVAGAIVGAAVLLRRWLEKREPRSTSHAAARRDL